MLRIFIVLFFCLTNLLSSQSNPTNTDIAELTYDELKDLYYKNYTNSDIAIEYATTYLNQAKTKNDTFNIAKGYNLLSLQFNIETNLIYTDSIIYLTKNFNDYTYPALGYSLKGYWHYARGDYKTAFKNYVRADSIAQRKNNIEQQIEVRQSMAALKNLWGEHKEALDLYKKHLLFIESQDNYNDRFSEDHLSTIYNLSLSFQRNNKIDSAEIYINKGLLKANELKDSEYINSFIFTSGVNAYLKRDFLIAREKIELTIDSLGPTSAAKGNYYLGKILLINNDEKYINKFIKVDSIFSVTNDEFPELRNTYEILINHSSNKKDLANELYYIKRLLTADSILDSNREYLNNQIIKQYEKPRLINQRKRIEQQLIKERKSSYLIFASMALTLLILAAILIFQLHKKKRYKQRVQELLGDNIKIAREPIKEERNIAQKIEPRDDVLIDIIRKLDVFEKEKQFLNLELKSTNVAKFLETNTTYLSKAVNKIKGESFSQYINRIRIEYILEQLKKNKILQKYTISALAEECSFGSTETFTKSFKKYTGVPISYFLKNL